MQFIALALFGSALAALPPIEIKGNAFYQKGSNDRFYIKGIDYQPGGASNVVDPLSDTTMCKRDIANFKDLGVNMVRIYTVDNSADHSECMKLLDDAGIYLLLDVNTPKNSLNRLDEASLKLSYNSGYLQSIFATIDKFKDYDNTFGFFAANEVINEVNNTIAAPYVKAVVRDMKTYISKQSNRKIPVGYSAADVEKSRAQQMAYFNCGDDELARIDMFGMNDYSWCGDKSSFTISGWSKNVEAYKGYSIPMFLSEYGCNKNPPRTFPEVKSLYSTDMSPVYSGGLVYEYTNESNSYGLVQISGNTVTKLTDYDNFKKALSAASNPSGDAGASTSNSISSCPAMESGTWEVDPSKAIPDTPAYAKRYFTQGAGEGQGFGQQTTQWGSSFDDPNASGAAASSAKASSTKSASSSASRSGSASGSAASSSSSNSAQEIVPIAGLAAIGAALLML